MSIIYNIIVPIVITILGCTGFWSFVQKQHEKHDSSQDLLLGLAHDRILDLGTTYLERGDWITKDEYENIHEYLYAPYERRGGNGSAKHVMNKIDGLYIVSEPPVFIKDGKNAERF